ncbi:DUF4199 domain-containing protein [Chondrinema litorale]|uniref:DUF4199 domain-containing protein n=1 Tax=Chondrinema litorale TaxID=2994555 RepID=UPI002543C943|nr:DUF4199 domain-containing protein [Chondrinema litorale]UZR94242.1 DUF4199 domain-containing protein [Chondrinema litorale]
MEDQASIKSVGVKYGLILGIFLIVYGLLLQVLDLAAEQSLGYLSFVFMIIMLVFAYKEFKGLNNGYMKLGQGIGLGMFVFLISTICSNIFSYFYLKFIDDSMLQLIVDNAREEMSRNPDLTDAQIEQALSMTASFTTPEMIVVIGFFTTMFFGFLISLIMSLIFKKDNPDYY